MAVSYTHLDVYKRQGDAHVGAVIAGLCVHADIKDILLFANDIAGAVVTKKGAGLEPSSAIKIYHQYF